MGHLKLDVWAGLRGSVCLDRPRRAEMQSAREHFLGPPFALSFPQDTLLPRAASGLAGQV